jgi:hypothetical protein
LAFFRFLASSSILAVLAAVRDSIRSRASLQMEVLALRHQLTVLQRSVKRPKLTASDRFLWQGWQQLGGAGVRP